MYNMIIAIIIQQEWQKKPPFAACRKHAFKSTITVCCRVVVFNKLSRQQRVYVFSPGFGWCDRGASCPEGRWHTRDSHTETEGLWNPDRACLRVLQVVHMNQNTSTYVYVEVLITVTLQLFCSPTKRPWGKMGRCLTALQRNISLKCTPQKWTTLSPPYTFLTVARMTKNCVRDTFQNDTLLLNEYKKHLKIYYLYQYQ